MSIIYLCSPFFSFPFCAMHTKKKTCSDAYFISLFKTKMAYKKNIILGGLIVLLGSIFFFWRAQAGTITFDWFAPWDTISSKYSMVHFGFPVDGDATNDLAWGAFWLPNIELNSYQELTYQGETRICRKQIRGLYHNASRGDRLWPIDLKSLNYLKQINTNYNNLSMSGGWYTTCSWGQNRMPWSDIYGQITFNESTYWDSTLSAWLMYTMNNTISASHSGFYPSLSYYNNETPVWYLFDSLGWVWFVWWIFKNHSGLLQDIKNDKGINDLFTWNTITGTGICYGTCINKNLQAWLETAWNLTIMGNTLLSRGWLDLTNRQSIFQNIGKKSAIMFSDLINISDILNELRRNASSLCVWKARMEDFPASPSEEQIICINQSDPSPFVIDLSKPIDYDKKDIIVQGRDVILENTMEYVDADQLPTLNIFIDKWNLYLKPDTPQFSNQTTGTYRTFDADAFYVWHTGGVTTGNLIMASGLAYAQMLRWNIFVNGVIAGFSGEKVDPEPWIMPNKYYIYGRLASLNTPLAPSDKRKTMVISMFWEDANLEKYLSLSSDVFLWSCGLNWISTDWTPCAVSWDYFKESAFILIREYIATNLFQ